MKFRRAASLVATIVDDGIVIENFLSRSRFTCSHECLQFLTSLGNWHTADKLFRYFPEIERGSVIRQILKLIELNAIVVSNTEQARLDDIYRKEWLWGESAGFFHFSIRDTRFITGKPARKFMRERKAWRASPKLHQPNPRSTSIPLPKVNIQRDPFKLMRGRRSQRKFDASAISLSTLADCLFAGNGIVGFIYDADFGRLPLSMTPSGGARNPFELYVYAKRVKDLEPGFYHYGAMKHDLGLVRAGRVNVPKILGTQTWPARAAAIIFLVAHFPRTMWKYHLPIAYRVIMMEAGFIGQNIALAATYHGLSAIPSGALATTLLENYLGTPPVESGVILSMNIGRPRD